MSEVHRVPIMIKLHAECESVVIPSILPLHGILVVAYVAAPTEPSFATSFGFHLRIDNRTHSMIV